MDLVDEVQFAKKAAISTLQRTSLLQNQEILALRNELGSLRKRLKERTDVITKLEKQIRMQNELLRERVQLERSLQSELEFKTLHINELADELQAVEDELIARRCSGIVQEFDDASTPSFAKDSISVERNRRFKQDGCKVFLQ